MLFWIEVDDGFSPDSFDLFYLFLPANDIDRLKPEPLAESNYHPAESRTGGRLQKPFSSWDAKNLAGHDVSGCRIYEESGCLFQRDVFSQRDRLPRSEVMGGRGDP